MLLYITFNISCTDCHFFRGNKYPFIYLFYLLNSFKQKQACGQGLNMRNQLSAKRQGFLNLSQQRMQVGKVFQIWNNNTRQVGVVIKISVNNTVQIRVADVGELNRIRI
jgi:hypothetical protein